MVFVWATRMDLKFLLVDLNSYSPDLFGVIERSFHDV